MSSCGGLCMVCLKLCLKSQQVHKHPRLLLVRLRLVASGGPFPLASSQLSVSHPCTGVCLCSGALAPEHFLFSRVISQAGWHVLMSCHMSSRHKVCSRAGGHQAASWYCQLHQGDVPSWRPHPMLAGPAGRGMPAFPRPLGLMLWGRYASGERAP